MQNLYCSSTGHASTYTIVKFVFPYVSQHASNPMMRGFRVALQIKFELAFDRNFDGKGEVKIHEAALSMN